MLLDYRSRIAYLIALTVLLLGVLALGFGLFIHSVSSPSIPGYTPSTVFITPPPQLGTDCLPGSPICNIQTTNP